MILSKLPKHKNIENFIVFGKDKVEIHERKGNDI